MGRFAAADVPFEPVEVLCAPFAALFDPADAPPAVRAVRLEPFADPEVEAPDFAEPLLAAPPLVEPLLADVPAGVRRTPAARRGR